MTNMKTKFKWRCTKCGDEVISDPMQHHTMDTCKCGTTSVDAEPYFTRFTGFYEYLGDVKEK
jgi:hypothetical protein